MDIDLEQLRTKWLLSKQDADGIAYLSALILSGVKVEISEFPLEVSQEVFKNLDSLVKCRPDNILLLGKSLPALIGAMEKEIKLYAENQNEFFRVHDIIGNSPVDETVSGLMKEQKYTLTGVWYPLCNNYPEGGVNGIFEDCFSIFAGFQAAVNYEWLASLITVRDGNLSLARFEEADGPLGYLIEFQFDLKSGGVTGINYPALGESGFWQKIRNIKGLERITSYPNESPTIVPHLIVFNQTDLSRFYGNPEISIGSCEDYPSCGHDICPPYLGHIQIAVVCVCGALLDKNSRTSLCERCLQGGGSSQGSYLEMDEDDSYDSEDDDFEEDI